MLLSGCACRAARAPGTLPPACVVAGTWTEPATARRPSHPAVLARAARGRIVLLGERHDVAEDHRWQLDVLAGLSARREELVIGFEAFSRGDQATLDAWSQGDLAVPQLLERTQWSEQWAVDPDLYLPLLHFTRRHRIPTLALNVDRGLVARVGRTGWTRIPPAERHGIGDPAPPAAAYTERLLASYAEHACRPPATVRATPEFTRFVDAQLLWDRAMAEALAAAAVRHEDALVVGVVGSGHLEGGDGIPHQLAALGWRDVLVLVPWDVTRDCADLRPGLADVVFGVAPPAAEASPAMRHRCAPAASPQPPR
jgi:uncharacterized iron-regulated protein